MALSTKLQSSIRTLSTSRTVRAASQGSANQRAYDASFSAKLKSPSSSSLPTTPHASPKGDPATGSALLQQSLQLPKGAAADTGPQLRPLRKNRYAAPYDLLPSEMLSGNTHKPKTPLLGPSRANLRQTDPFLALNMDPLKEVQNPNLFNSYLTEMGRIVSRNKSGLGWKNQRRMGKAVRRARCMGLLPYWNKLPLVHES